MSTDLEQFRDHCRRMATAQHRDQCHALVEQNGFWRTPKEVHPDPACPGCVSDSDRRLFAALADEVDGYLTEPEEATLL